MVLSPLLVWKLRWETAVPELSMIFDDHAERIPRYQVFPPPRDIMPASGVLYAATQGTRERGELIVNQVVAAMADIARQELDG